MIGTMSDGLDKTGEMKRRIRIRLFHQRASAALQSVGMNQNPFRAQLDEDWKYWMAEYPELATAYGYPGQNSRWTDYSKAAIDSARRLSQEEFRSFESHGSRRS